ncbi:TPA: hypothetical protein RUY97_002865 [Aeromonas dhakensis]|nr:hypothetical protein [Aeromonas dhakensis]HDX8486302.1 hypothetical protein [Aeromonas dhakensis]HDX8512931.1 hypothetical protein [Aeromonas dhakensis]HDZ8906761.1 hypothetical protein [Aeromonas dhakensis]HDZ9333056.1 hypothetical protein [Aeromonas dhakensis]
MTFEELYALQCKVFEPATADFSMRELKILLNELLDSFPHEDDGKGNIRPYKPSRDESVMWFKSYDHLITLMNIKRDESKNRRTFWISISALVVSVITAAAQAAFHAS